MRGNNMDNMLNEFYKNEILKVKSLGESIGYGNLMDIASILWGHQLKRNGVLDNGALYPMIIDEIKEGKLKEDAILNRQQKYEWYKELGIWED